MEVTIERLASRSGWVADLQPRPGSPHIGTGRTKSEALAALLFLVLLDGSYKPESGEILWVNGRKWRDIKGVQKR